jgi:Rhodopirellula transposase DDE domain
MLEPMKKLAPYGEEIEAQMQNLYQSLSEKDRRRYAAVEAKKLGYGGISYVCRLFGCDESSVNRGGSELETLQSAQDKRIREAGGGRKKLLDTMPGLDEAFLAIMSDHTAGSPMDETIKWSNLSREKIADRLVEKGYPVSVTVVAQLLARHDFRRRQAFKNEAGKDVENRDAQFTNIENLVADARENGNPIMSMDVKKKS